MISLVGCCSSGAGSNVRLCTMPTELLERYTLPELGATFRLLTGTPVGAADIYRDNEQKRPRGLI
jgi:hypothetical protein